jgi:hypothetical protein
MNQFSLCLSEIFSSKSKEVSQIENELSKTLITEVNKSTEAHDIKSKTFDITKLFLAYPRTKNLALKDDLDVNKCFYQCHEKDNKITCDMSHCESKLKEILIQEPKVRKFCESITNDFKEEDKYLQSRFDSFQIFYRPTEPNKLSENEPLDELNIDKLKAFHVINFNRKDSNRDGRSGVIELNPKRLSTFK